MTSETISSDRLVPGLYIQLKVGWLKHPFLLNRFKIKTAAQVAALRQAGIGEVVLVRERSDPQALAALDRGNAVPAAPADPAAEAAAKALWEEKQQRMERVRVLRAKLQATEKRFERSADRIKGLMRDLASQPRAAEEESKALITEMTQVFLDERDATLNVMHVRGHEENLYYHALNVTVLAMMLGAAAELKREEMHALGLGALFHDIGKTRIPTKILYKQGPRTKPEQALYELHPRYGKEMMARLEMLPPRALAIIEQHHEMPNGGGFPHHLQGPDIDPLARIVAIANTYDNYCNPPDPTTAIPPAEALAHMYTRRQGGFDEGLLALFIRMLGVYPPGSVVALSDGSIGMVVSLERDELLRPTVLLYDPEIPRREAMMINLREEADLDIKETLSPRRLSPEVYEYLSPQARMNYFMDAQDKS